VKTKILNREILENNISAFAEHISSVGGNAWWQMRKEAFPVHFVTEMKSAKE